MPIGTAAALVAARHQEPASLKVLLTAVLVAVIGLFALAGFLTQRYYAARTETAVQFYKAGNEFLRAKRDPEAIEQYRAALSLTHRNEHRLAIALVLAKTGRADEAEMYLREVTRTDPGSSAAQLALARIAAKKGRTAADWH